MEALKNQSIDEIYKLKENYLEGITEIFLSLAAKSLSEMAYSNGRTTPDRTSDSAKRVVEYLKLSDEKLRINEYTWLIKGFYEIIQGKRSLQIAHHVESLSLTLSRTIIFFTRRY